MVFDTGHECSLLYQVLGLDTEADGLTRLFSIWTLRIPLVSKMHIRMPQESAPAAGESPTPNEVEDANSDLESLLRDTRPAQEPGADCSGDRHADTRDWCHHGYLHRGLCHIARATTLPRAQSTGYRLVEG
jgi:hypothetical protein